MRFLVGLFFLLHLTAYATESHLKVSCFYDGDTVKIKDNLYEYKLRLTDIDAPERNQTHGKTARRALINLCSNTNVHVYLYGKDKYQRNLGKLVCNDIDASVYMINNGHAWYNRHFSMDYSLDIAEQTARQNKLGLWHNPAAIPPWQWRKNHAQKRLN
jgi:micrococcal nuclease